MERWNGGIVEWWNGGMDFFSFSIFFACLSTNYYSIALFSVCLLLFAGNLVLCVCKFQ